MRSATVERNTTETQIYLALNLDGTGQSDVDTGVGFLDHMLTLLAKHSGCDLTVHATGDIHVDAHHLTEDIGIVLGMAIKQSLGEKRGIRRYGDITLPMDETLMLVAIDCSGRPYLAFNVKLPRPKVGDWDSELTEDFFRALAFQGGLTLHLTMLAGNNTHHIVEAAFKGFARAFRSAITVDLRENSVPSTKGTLN